MKSKDVRKGAVSMMMERTKDIPLYSKRESMLKNVQGTFAAEGMILSESCLENLDRIINGQASYSQVLSELRTKYEKRV